MISQRRSKRKPTGGRYKKDRKKRKSELGNRPLFTKIGDKKIQIVRVRGGNLKLKVVSLDFANVYDPKTKKAKKAKILSVIENKANPHFVRRNIITKGAIIETEIGKAKVTNRPSQEGTINAVLV
ncbi:30S ribosomal protein S8e [Candidatus Woesearchaeota archaeon]|nr:MAG: 30S ribosomal protein S8e [Candidatus Woesearchaeota archaeon]HDM43641.1 30S ribosomal protein S8e [Candidatus Woesearchaeota archaeon]